MKFCQQFSTCVVRYVAFLRPFGRVFHSFFRREIETALRYLLDFLNHWPKTRTFNTTHPEFVWLSYFRMRVGILRAPSLSSAAEVA
jgi:hypothetical protein